MKIDGVTAVAMLLVVSFAIDRLVAAVFFLLSYTKAFPDPATIEDQTVRARAEKKKKLVYFIFAGILGGVILAYYGNIRILHAMGLTETNWLLDTIVTGLILIGGSERIAQLQKIPGAPGVEKPAQQPIEITGKLILEDSAGKKVVAAPYSINEKRSEI